MTPAEMLQHCRDQVRIQGSMGRVVFWLPGRGTPSGMKRLFDKHGGPMGDVLIEDGEKCLCIFDAGAVMDALVKNLGEASGE